MAVASSDTLTTGVVKFVISVSRDIAKNELAFCSANRDGLMQDMKVLQSAAFKPAKYFFIGMFGLIPRGIPVEGVQDTPPPISLQTDKRHSAEEPAEARQFIEQAEARKASPARAEK